MGEHDRPATNLRLMSLSVSSIRAYGDAGIGDQLFRREPLDFSAPVFHGVEVMNDQFIEQTEWEGVCAAESH